MRQLSVRETDDNGLTFDLLVDGSPLIDFVGARGMAGIPYWLVPDEDMALPADSMGENDIRIVAVCSCGECGCGCVTCRISELDDRVLFSDFDGQVTGEGRSASIEVSLISFRDVLNRMRAEASRRRVSGSP